MHRFQVTWLSRGWSQVSLALTMLLSGVACRSTIDTLGTNDPRETGPRSLKPLKGPPGPYPNAFRDVLGKSDAEISAKIADAFRQLFHDDPTTKSIFFPVGTDQANIQDVFPAHSNEIRTEGMGLGMLIAVELNKKTEFDQLWRYAKAELMETSGPTQGYFKSYCDTSNDGLSPPQRCWDPFGLQQFVMSLIFAHDRWQANGPDASVDTINYEADVWMLLDTMRFKERDNGGVVGGITNTFDSVTHLVFNEPLTTSSNFTKPSAEMPAYYELWAQATGDSFWSDAAASARAYWKTATNPNTGLQPDRAYFTGAPYPGWDLFAPEAYRTQLNMTLDWIWNSKEPWEQTEADALIGFFSSFGSSYGRIFKLDGTVIDQTTMNEPALVASNGITALISANPNRAAFVTAAWNLPTPTGTARYYAGLMDLLALMAIGGQFRIY
jgi:oligosaccharide reducing-end xylanase